MVQNSNERVAILEPRHQVYLLHHVTQDEYLPLNHQDFVKLVSHPPDGHGCQDHQTRKGFCCSREAFDPKGTAFCSETPDEDALILFDILV
jgi:hypothetical protein